MKLTENTQKLSHVPAPMRVFCYDASVVIDFLETCYEQPYPLLIISEMKPFTLYNKKYFKNPAHYMRYRRSMLDLYGEYILWRKGTDYTVPIESEYVFKMIIGKMRFSRNRWQFVRFRGKPDQTVYITPLVPKGQMPPARELE